MSWDALGAIAEAIAAVGVIASLAFVGFQVRQNTRALKATALREVMRDMAEDTRQLSQSAEMARIWWDGLADVHALSTVERRQFAAYAANMCRHFEIVLYEAQGERLDDDQWHGLRESLRMQVRQPGFRDWWRGARDLPGANNLFNRDVQEFVEELMEDRKRA